MSTFFVQRGQRDRSLYCPDCRLKREFCRVCVAVLVLGSPEYEFYFMWSG